jgi:sulfoxide reductase heme-binding subunit YedZ
MTEHVFWITSRAAGITALLASSLAVALGLMMSTRLRTRLGDLRVIHESLSLATMVALAVHAFSLLGDSYINLSLADVTIPFVSSYQRLWMSVGIVAGWTLVILGLSYYFRGRIGPQRWRKLHRFTALAWVLGIGHALMMGTDAGTAWFLLAGALVVIPAGALLVRRYTPTTPVHA